VAGFAYSIFSFLILNNNNIAIALSLLVYILCILLLSSLAGHTLAGPPLFLPQTCFFVSSSAARFHFCNCSNYFLLSIVSFHSRNTGCFSSISSANLLFAPAITLLLLRQPLALISRSFFSGFSITSSRISDCSLLAKSRVLYSALLVSSCCYVFSPLLGLSLAPKQLFLSLLLSRSYSQRPTNQPTKPVHYHCRRF
jgi:hypothetical protein